MKKSMSIIFLLVSLSTIAQIERGADENEIYIASQWCFSTYVHKGIFYSNDNGKNLSLQYDAPWTAPPGVMEVWNLRSDATPGIIYNYYSAGLWISYNYGVTWDTLLNNGLGSFECGAITGEIYRNTSYPDNIPTLYMSFDYGQCFNEIRDSVSFSLEAGCESGELYGYEKQDEEYYLYRSIDSGNTFTSILIDTNIANPNNAFINSIHSGPNTGELYLVSRHQYAYYHIYYSSDYGNHFQLQYVSDSLSFYFWGYSFAAGKEPGSFYVSRLFYPHLENFYLYIDYSNDTAQTFKTYYHDLGLFAGYEHDSFQAFNDLNLKIVNLTGSGNRIFEFDVPDRINLNVRLYNIKGELIEELCDKQFEKGRYQLSHQFNSDASNGIYIISFLVNNQYYVTRKFSFN